MAATLMLGAIGIGAIPFLIWFLVALIRETRPKSHGYVAHLSSQAAHSEDYTLGTIAQAGVQPGQSDSLHPTRFEVIPGGNAERTRRAG